MRMRSAPGAAVIVAAGAGLVAEAHLQYVHSETMVGQDFFEPFRFSFHTADDPTHGRVDYLDYRSAAHNGLVNATFDRVYMGADHTHAIKHDAGRGRPSVRIVSQQTYNGGMFVLKLDHVPTGCGVWPAFWMYGEDPEHIWPTWGEYDIIEGVHEDEHTQTTLHTTGGCDQSEVHGRGRNFTGRWEPGVNRKANDCDVNARGQWGNQGCSQSGPEGSLGKSFNENGGGTFAAEWDPAGGHFRTWFFRAGRVPIDLELKRPKPTTWGKPYSYFELSEDDCDKDHFKDMRLVFDITFCGDFGGPTFAGSCPEVAKKMTCEEFVEQHPENFTEAYWSIRGMDVYQVLNVEQGGTTGGPSKAPPVVQHQWPDVFGRFGVPVDVFGDGKAPPKAVTQQGDPWAPPVAPEVYENEAASRGRVRDESATASPKEGRPTLPPLPPGATGPRADAAQAAEAELRGPAAEAAAEAAKGQHQQFTEPEYLPIAMKDAKQKPVQPVRALSGWNFATLGVLAVAAASLVAGIWRSRGRAVASRVSSLTLSITSEALVAGGPVDGRRYQELRTGAAPLPTDTPDFEL